MLCMIDYIISDKTFRSTVISSPLEQERRIRFEFPDASSSDEEIDPLVTNAMREYDKYIDWFHHTGRENF